MTFEVVAYTDSRGRQPVNDWLIALRDAAGAERILKRIRRVRSGNLGDFKPVGGGVLELRVDVGPGYRIYFAKDGARLILLLCGGDKSTQHRDIARAQSYWQDYLRRK